MLVEERVDVTLPWDRRPRGARHPLTTLMERIGDLFVGMGYEIAEGPEVELEWANFDALNIAPGPPGARPDGHVLRRRRRRRGGSGLVLRTHTSPVQARTMLTRKPPIYVVVPGPGLPHRRAGRHAHARSSTRSRAWSSTRASRWPTCKGTLDHFARAMFGAGGADPAGGRTTSRSPSRRPSSTCGSPQHRDGPRWVEWGGCGMVNPRVLRACGIDPERVLRVRVRHGHRAHADVPQRRQRHARHGRGRRAVHPRVRDGGAEHAGRRLSWLREYVDAAGRPDRRASSSRALIDARHRGRVDRRPARPRSRARWSSAGCSTIEELTGFKKPIRFCPVDVGEANGTGEPQEIVCGATNFAVGDLVVVILPGGVLPGGFTIGARKTYGHNSNGMICSARELGISDDHAGIIVLPPDTAARPATTPGRSSGLDDVVRRAGDHPGPRATRCRCAASPASCRTRSASPFTRPGARPTAPGAHGRAGVPGDGATTRSAATGSPPGVVRGVDPAAPTPAWMQRRLTTAGIRTISLAVDITNYVMLELGQPMHAFDADRLRGAAGGAPGRGRARS